MLITLEAFRDKLALSLKDVRLETAKRSAYNFIYGISLYTFFRRKGLIKVKIKKGVNSLGKIRFMLDQLQKQCLEFFCVDLPEYDKDDYTLKFEERLLIEVTREVIKLNSKELSFEEFWKVQEEFFISSF